MEIFKKQCELSLPRFKERVGALNYIANGILLWEGFAFCSLLDMYGIEMIIESGVAGGASTEIWASYFQGKIFAIDNTLFYGPERFVQTAERLKKYDKVEFINGDSFFEMEEMVKKNSDKKIALFIDGPKGKGAEALAKKMFAFDNVVFAGIHDQNGKDGRHPMDDWNKKIFFTDAKWFLEKYSFLDLEKNDPLIAEELKRKPGGPCIGFAGNFGVKDNWLKVNLAYYREKLKSLFFSFLIRSKRFLSKN